MVVGGGSVGGRRLLFGGRSVVGERSLLFGGMVWGWFTGREAVVEEEVSAERGEGLKEVMAGGRRGREDGSAGGSNK